MKMKVAGALVSSADVKDGSKREESVQSRTFRCAVLAGSTALGAILSLAVATSVIASAQERVPTQERAKVNELPVPARGETSYMPVVAKDFDEVFKKMSANKDEVMKRAQALLEERYDLADRPAKGGSQCHAASRCRVASA